MGSLKVAPIVSNFSKNTSYTFVSYCNLCYTVYGKPFTIKFPLIGLKCAVNCISETAMLMSKLKTSIFMWLYSCQYCLIKPSL